MASCDHCGTEFAAKTEADRYCCRGCEYVAALISEQGFERFYDLKQGVAVAPVKSRPFEEHDFSWLAGKVADAERRAAVITAAAGGAAGADAVRTAFGLALLYNLTAVAISMAGKMSPLLAAVLMPLSSLASIAIVAGISRRKFPNKG